MGHLGIDDANITGAFQRVTFNANYLGFQKGNDGVSATNSAFKFDSSKTVLTGSEFSPRTLSAQVWRRVS